MIRFRLAELMADKGFREGRRIEIGEVADATGIHRSTLSRILNVRGSNVTSANMDLLCRHFGCTLGELAEYVPDESLAQDKPAPKKAVTEGKSAAAAKKADKVVGRGRRRI
jgi:putative transcriptional regulator